MSHILFNFASNLMLAAAETRIQGIRHPGQWPLQALAFADNTVFGLSCARDADQFQNIMDLYQRASNTKANIDKTIVINCGSLRYSLPTGYQPSPPTEVFRHLDILFTTKGIALAEMESKSLSNLVNQMSKWKYKLLDLNAKIQALNVFVCSKLWYVAHPALFTQVFEKN
ncbi:hypothetical protein DSO57_1009316 [Entomophthora muscae]|uniref:Uncharacterized protein n=1 Tax=Entomophthora muscae TaxID=34485 RepID=A0ACC2RLI0_9FUNG|nr:hypothetical protein DSO57_1009316 [Entomophthora muscae]